MEQEGREDLPADLLALVCQALLRLAAFRQDGPSDGAITVKAAGELLAACSPCRHWRFTMLARVRQREDCENLHTCAGFSAQMDQVDLSGPASCDGACPLCTAARTGA